MFLKKIALVEDFWAILISIEHISKPQGRQKIIKSKRACPSIVITKKRAQTFHPVWPFVLLTAWPPEGEREEAI